MYHVSDAMNESFDVENKYITSVRYQAFDWNPDGSNEACSYRERWFWISRWIKTECTFWKIRTNMSLILGSRSRVFFGNCPEQIWKVQRCTLGKETNLYWTRNVGWIWRLNNITSTIWNIGAIRMSICGKKVRSFQNITLPQPRFLFGTFMVETNLWFSKKGVWISRYIIFNWTFESSDYQNSDAVRKW